VDDAIDPVALGDYLTYGFVPAPRTIYRSIRVLPPAHTLGLSRGADRLQRYWQVRRRDDLPRTLPAAAEALEELLDDAVRIRLESEVPLGALLSGGIDSGLVVALMSRHMQEPVRTFSVGFQEASHDELPAARRVAEMYGTRHTEFICRPQVAELLPRIANAFDQPFGDSSAVPTWYVSEVARRDVTVALSGDGGDEGFAGYRRHLLAWRRRVRRRDAGVTGALARALAPAIPPLFRGAQRLRRVGLDDAQFQVDCLVLAEDRLKAQLAGERLREEDAAFDSVQIGLSAGGEFEGEGGIRRFQHQDLTLYLPNDVLEKVDRMSMAHSLEVRGPLLDYRVVEFGLNLEPTLKVGAGVGKLPLRALAQRLLPPGHLERPKSGFGIPVARWLRNELRETLDDCLASSSLAAEGWLSQTFLRSLLRRHDDGHDHGTILWSLLMLELWHRSRTSHEPVGAAHR
jgi:asparagine synthase (glutamine-hydrolysing)